jgi:hypothetical protein
MLAPEYTQDLGDISLEEIRARSADCRRVEDLVSYLRRVVQGQIDLVVAEIDMRRTSGGEARHPRVDDLPGILSASRPGAGPEPDGRTRETAPVLSMPAPDIFIDDEGLSPDEIAAAIAPELTASDFKGEGLPGANLESFADNELEELLGRLRRNEGVLSAERKVLHERIDVLQATVVERYKTGAADVDSLLEGNGLAGGDPGYEEDEAGPADAAGPGDEAT